MDGKKAVPHGQILHGEANSLGIKAALFLSEQQAGLTPATSLMIVRLLEKFHLPLVLPPSITTEAVMDKLAKDKKFAAGAIRFVVLEAAGSATVTTAITGADLRQAIEHLR